MRRHVPLLSAVLFLCCDGPALAQEARHPAEWVPAKSLVYAELREPGMLARELAGLFEASALGNVPDSLAKIRAEEGRPRFRGDIEEAAAAGLLWSPEVVNELGRIRGAVVAVTGMDKEEKRMPEFVVIMLPGESNAPSFLLRAFITASHSSYGSSNGKERVESRTAFEPAGEVEGVRLYRQVERRTKTLFGPDGAAGVAGKPEVRTHGPALAFLPGALLIGSTGLVKDTIHRIKSKNTDGSLAGVKAFQEADKELGVKSGLFLYADPSGVVDLIDREAPLAPRERERFHVVKGLVNPKAIGSVADALTLDNGTLSYRRLVHLNTAEKSPLLEVLPAKPLPAGMLHFAPKDALLVAALSNGDGEERWEKLLKLADSIAKAVDGRGPIPSEQVGQLEQVLSVKFGNDIAGKIAGLAVAVPGPQRIKGAGPQAPPVVVVVQATDEQAAKSLASETVPQLFGVVTGQPGVKPIDKKVGGQTISMLESGKAPLCYGRHGATLVFGMQPALVAESLSSGAKQEGFLRGEKAGRAKEAPVAFVALKPFTMTSFFVLQRSEAAPPLPRGGGRPDGGVARAAEAGPDREVHEFLRLAELEEPLTLTITRKPDRILAEARYPGLKKLAPRVIDLLVIQVSKSPGGSPAAPRPVTRPTEPPRPPRER